MAGNNGKFDAAQAITDEIIALLGKGTIPWRQPWKIAGGGVPLRHNGEAYRGINAFLLGLRAAVTGYGAPSWMTFQQAKSLGASVRKGERSSVVVYYGTAGMKPEADDVRGAEGGEVDASSACRRFLKNYRVFNVEQIEGLDPDWYPEPESPSESGPDPIPELDAFFASIGADVVFGGDRACYVPSLDRIHMPPLERFESASLMYSTLAHEHCHWTGADHRLDRGFGESRFGNDAYAQEELVAEIAAALLGQRMGFLSDHIENHAAYLNSWLKTLRGDKRFLFKAAGHAQRAVDFLIDASGNGVAAPDEVAARAARPATNTAQPQDRASSSESRP